MRAWIISDIHTAPLGRYRGGLAVPDADICICAGDTTGNISSSMDYLLAEVASHMPVIAVLGNHDFYGTSIDRAFEIARKRLAGTNVHLLENNVVVMGGVRFIGATLWTDFEVEHGGPELPVDVRRTRAFHVCTRDIADFSAIHRSDERKHGETGYITIQEMIMRHRASRKFIETELSTPFHGKTVVVTHHAPSPRSRNPAFDGSPSNGAFASDLTKVILHGSPDYWIHGHIHLSADYFEGETRVLCNPQGYRHERNFTEFRPGFVIEL